MHQKRNPRALSAEHELLGESVREMRTKRKLSQERLGFQSGLHRNYVGAVERGEINMTFRTMLRLCAGLASTVVELMAHYEDNVWASRDDDTASDRARSAGPQRST